MEEIKRPVCPGCLRDVEQIATEGCGSQRCPDFEVMTEAEIENTRVSIATTEKLLKSWLASNAENYIKKKPIKFDAYIPWVRKMWMSEEIQERDITIMSLGLAEEAGEVLSILKKRVRDNTFDVGNFKKEMGDVLYYWIMLCHAFEVDPIEVMTINRDKLESRLARGTLKGSGDDR